MKKCGIFAIAALMTILCGRLNAAVESDIVGYTTITLEGGKWYMIANPFVELEGDKTSERPITINNLFKDGFAAGDQAYIYDTEASVYGAQLRYATLNGVPGWYNAKAKTLDETVLAVGHAFYIYKKTTGAVTFAGKVDFEQAVVFGDASTSSWAQITCMYPESAQINEWQWNGMTSGDMAYIYSTDNGAYDKPLRWATMNGVTGWYNTDTRELSTKTLTPGQAIFLYKKSGVGSCLPPKQS